MPSFIRLGLEEFDCHPNQHKWVPCLEESCYKVIAIEDFHILDFDKAANQLDHIFIPESSELEYPLSFETHDGIL